MELLWYEKIMISVVILTFVGGLTFMVGAALFPSEFDLRGYIEQQVIEAQEEE